MPYRIEERECGGVGHDVKIYYNEETPTLKSDENLALSNNCTNLDLVSSLQKKIDDLNNKFAQKDKKEKDALEAKRLKKAYKELYSTDFSEYGTYIENSESDMLYDESNDVAYCRVEVQLDDDIIAANNGYDSLEDMAEFHDIDSIDKTCIILWRAWFKKGSAKIDEITLDGE